MTSRRFALLALLVCVSAGAASAQPRTIHVYVALADNQNQGIVPVPAHLGNGDDPARNLYWGAAFGVRTYLQRSAKWQLVSRSAQPHAEVLERVVFKHRDTDTYLIADAYQGRAIRRALEDFLSAAAGAKPETLALQVAGASVSLKVAGGANLIAYIGHNGLMDFQLPTYPKLQGDSSREAIILACASRSYFTDALRATGATPLLWTTGLMAPEAYTLHDALEGWIKRESPEEIRQRAAAAYHRYQKCGLRAAQRLLVTGFPKAATNASR